MSRINHQSASPKATDSCVSCPTADQYIRTGPPRLLAGNLIDSMSKDIICNITDSNSLNFFQHYYWPM